MASSAETGTKDEGFSVDLPAPPGWQKKLMPKASGTPKKSEIIFIAPTGEEITSRRQLEQYLKAHTGSPSASEFDWGTGETPRRSARISEKTKAILLPQSEPRKKRSRKSSASRKGDTGASTEGTQEMKEIHMQVAEKGDAKGEKDAKETKDENRDEDQDSVAKETKEEKEKVEGEMILVKDEQSRDESAKEHNSGEIKKVDTACDEENEKEVEVQDKEKHDRCVSETEGVIKDKEALNDNDKKPDQTGTGEPNEKVEGEVVENGSSGNDPRNVNP